ncbi:cupin domain-containing protein [Amaricoccus sp.]|uniref:cupin domain-containing protein n=1 Tax=Amaricoccus sp. TaxID=1872485 RepID=UPI001B5876B3|nr:cupin domain-containing protein [Amaricoccus sp.]MBP7001493.1 cupin domain-containing protein [Amaricoccus sp.]
MSHNIADVAEHDVVPGFHGRFIHSERMTFAYWRIDAGSAIPVHAHPHEQVVNMLEGELELVVDGEPRLLKAGDVYVVPGGVEHGARAVTDVRVLDVFAPVREDYRF